jgi:hypothetical protein
MLENEAHHDPLSFSEDSCGLDDKRRFISNFYAVVSDPTRLEAAHIITS